MPIALTAPHSPRQLIITAVAVVIVAVASTVALLSTADDADSRTELMLSANFGAKVTATSPSAIGFGSSTYGALATDNPTQASAERTLDARSVRLPVRVRDGGLASGAAGAHPVDIVKLVRLYRSWGMRVMVVIGGRTTDADVAPGDTTTIVRALGYRNGVEYTSSNEPTLQGHTVQDAIASAKTMLAEGRRLFSDFTLWGPAWAYYDRGAVATFANALGSGLAGIDYHRYGMGETSLSTAAVMARTPQFGREVSSTRADLRKIGLSPRVAVDETNLSFRYDYGNGAVEPRFFTSVNTVWLASMCGHVMYAGGQCLPYASQNGALGLTVQAGGPNPDQRPVASPMPAYWGIATWTGAKRFPHMGDTFYAAFSPNPDVEVFAVNNTAGGKNLVVINKGTAKVTAQLKVSGVAAGTYVTYTTDPAAPYRAPAASAAKPFSTTLPVSLPGMAVAVYVLSR